MGNMGAAIGDWAAIGKSSPLVFVSYSRKDAKWRDKFVLMLGPDVRERRVEVWTDQHEVVGEEWRPQPRGPEMSNARSGFGRSVVSRCHSSSST